MTDMPSAAATESATADKQDDRDEVPAGSTPIGFRQLLRSASATAILQATSRAAGFLTALLLARFLGREGYGLYAFSFAWAGVLAFVSTIGVDRFLVRGIALYEVQKKWQLMQGLLRRSNQLVLIMLDDDRHWRLHHRVRMAVPVPSWSVLCGHAVGSFHRAHFPASRCDAGIWSRGERAGSRSFVIQASAHTGWHLHAGVVGARHPLADHGARGQCHSSCRRVYGGLGVTAPRTPHEYALGATGIRHRRVDSRVTSDDVGHRNVDAQLLRWYVGHRYAERTGGRRRLHSRPKQRRADRAFHGGGQHAARSRRGAVTRTCKAAATGAYFGAYCPG